jgi:hypothetical protein
VVVVKLVVLAVVEVDVEAYEVVDVVVVVVRTSRLNTKSEQSGIKTIFSFGAMTTPLNLRP